MKLVYVLAPCRACGGAPELNTDSYSARVRCTTCGAATGLYEAPEDDPDDKVACDRAVAAWNKANAEVAQ